MSKEQDNKFLNVQTCVLKVNICCDGCQKKVKKVLHNIDGVYTTTIDAEGRKVTVTGSADPATLIKKLSKAGKHAELWSAKGGILQKNQLQKLQLEHAKGEHMGNGKSKKSGGGGGGGGSKDQKGQQPQKQKLQQQLQQQVKGFKDLKFPNLKDLKFPFKKEKKTVKFDLPPMEESDDGSDYDDFDEDEDLDGFGEHIYGDPKMMKPMNIQPNAMAKDKKGGGGGKGKGEEVQVQNKGGGGNNHVVHGSISKNGGGNKSKGGKNANISNLPYGSNKGGVGGGPPVGHPNMMGQMGHMHTAMGLTGNIPAVHSLPAGGGAPPGYFPGGMVPLEMMAGANRYQQQYLQALMQQQQQQQQRMMMMMNGRPAYVPPPPPQGEPYTMFSDENPNSCSIM